MKNPDFMTQNKIPRSFEYSKILSQDPYIGEKLDRIHRTPRVSVGEIVACPEKLTRIGPRIQDRFELLIVREGSIHLRLDGQRSTVESGTVALLKPGHMESLQIEKGTRYHQIWCIIRKERLPAVLLSRILSIQNGFAQSESPELKTMIDLALSVQQRDRSIDVPFYEALVVAIFFEFARIADFPSEKGEGILPPGLLRALEFMEQNLPRQITLEEIATKSGVAKHYLVKLFKTRMEETPVRFLWNLRIQKGAELLRSSGLNVAEISDATGFQSPFHFSRLFKKTQGLSPKQFREKMWHQAEISTGERNEAE